MVSDKNGKVVHEESDAYVMEAPDGGWGYVVVFAVFVIFAVTIIPLSAFGLIYGEFVRSVGDETTGTAVSNAIFNTVSSFTGLLANGLLATYSYRKVGFMGAVIFTTGAIGLPFVQNLAQLIVFFGVIEGIGFGLLMPAALSAFNSFFNKRMTVMMSVCQTLIIAFNMAVPSISTWSMHVFGFRGTLTGLVILSTLAFPAVASLQPVKKHLKKVNVTTINSTVIPVETTHATLPQEIIKDQQRPLVDQDHHISASKTSVHNISASRTSLHSHHLRARKSVISLGDRVASVLMLNEIVEEEKPDPKLPFWQRFLKSMDMSLFKDLRYVNISTGMSLCFTGDMAFISIIPLMMRNLGFEPKEIALMMAVFFGSDLVSRILLTGISTVLKFRSRMLVLVTSVFIVIARTALVSNDTFMWKITCLGMLGFLRCFIQTPLPLVFSEEYPDKFATAYSLFMVVNGVVSLICGALMSFVRAQTQSDVMVCHVLSAGYLICIMSWIIELTIFRKKEVK